MPAVVSHYLLAERIFKSLTEYEPQLKLNHTAFLWGAYGPDIFFSHRVLPWQKGKSLSFLAKKMHSTGAEKIINYLMSYAKNTESFIAESYALGFITHYALDSTVHPFVNCFAEIMEKKNPSMHRSICHNDIEANLDTIFLKYETGTKISDFKLQETSPVDEDVSSVIAKALHAFFAGYGIGNISPSAIVQAQHDWHNSLCLLNSRSTLKKSFVSLGEKMLHLSPMLSPIIRTTHIDLSFDYANMKHSEWHNPNDINEVHKEDFFELVNIAEERSLNLILTVISGRTLTHRDCAVSFSG